MNNQPTPSPAPESSAPAAKQVVAAAPRQFSPAAFHLPVALRENAIQRITGFKPEGNPKSELVTAAKTLVLALIDSHPPEFTGIEVKVEIGGAIAHQVMAIVIPHKL